MASPDYGPLFEAAGKQYDIDPLLLQQIAKVEGGVDSQGRPLTSSAGARGLMQFMPGTAAQYGVDVNDPTSSVFGAARYLSDLRRRTGDNLQQMLSLYGGDSTLGYANKVMRGYGGLVAQRSAAPGADAGSDTAASGAPAASYAEPGIKITMKALPAPGGADQGGANFIPPPQTPSTYGVSDQPGSRAQHPIAESEFGAAKPADFASSFFSTAAPAQSKDDFANSFFAPPSPPQRAAQPTVPAAPALQPAAVPPATLPAAQSAPTPVAAPSAPPAAQPIPAPPSAVTPQSIPAPAAAPSAAAPAPTPAAASAPQSWWTRNVTTPLAAMDNPLTAQPPDNYFLGIPVLQSIGAGIGQGFRDIGETANAASRYLDQRIPLVAAADRALGFDPNAPDPLTAQRQAYEKQYAGEPAAEIARLGSNIAFSAPLLENPVAWAGRAAEAVPGAVNAAGTLTRGGALLRGGATGAVAGGLGNALTSAGYGEDPATAAEIGALGGGVLGVGLGAIGNKFLRPTERVAAERTDLADKLDIPLSTGDRLGGFWKRLEDTNSIFPGSGNALKNQVQRQAIAQLLNGEMGQGAGDWIDYRTLAQATQDIGNRIDNAASRISITAPPGNPAFTRTLNNIQTAANQMSPTQGAPAARGLIDEIQNIQAHNGGAIPGADFQRLIQRGSLLDDAVTSGDPEVRRVGIRVKSALLDAAQASPTANPADLQAFQQGRYQWKVLKTIDGAIEKTVGGTDEMSMPALARDIRGEFDMLQDRPMPNLARLIDTTKGIASSGTAERAWWQKALGFGGETAGPSGLLWALNYPHAVEQGLPYAAVGTGLNYLTARLSRFGPSLGYDWLGNLQRTYNPLLSRVAGPYAGHRLNDTWQSLYSGQQQPAPGARP